MTCGDDERAQRARLRDGVAGLLTSPETTVHERCMLLGLQCVKRCRPPHRWLERASEMTARPRRSPRAPNPRRSPAPAARPTSFCRRSGRRGLRATERIDHKRSAANAARSSARCHEINRIYAKKHRMVVYSRTTGPAQTCAHPDLTSFDPSCSQTHMKTRPPAESARGHVWPGHAGGATVSSPTSLLATAHWGVELTWRRCCPAGRASRTAHCSWRADQGLLSCAAVGARQDEVLGTARPRDPEVRGVAGVADQPPVRRCVCGLAADRWCWPVTGEAPALGAVVLGVDAAGLRRSWSLS